jgi:hypothetical protein
MIRAGAFRVTTLALLCHELLQSLLLPASAIVALLRGALVAAEE